MLYGDAEVWQEFGWRGMRIFPTDTPAACGPSCELVEHGRPPGRMSRTGRTAGPATSGGELLAGEQFLGEHRVLGRARGRRGGAAWRDSRAAGPDHAHPSLSLAGSTSALVEDLVAVALLGQEQLAVVGEVQLAGVAGHQRVEVGRLAVALGRRMRPSRCASSWREPNVPETWISTLASGRSMAKLPTFERIRCRISPRRNLPYRSSRSAFGVWPGDERQVEALGEPAELLEVLADDRARARRGSGSSSSADDVVLGRVLAGEAVLVAPLGDGVFHAHGRPAGRRGPRCSCASAIQPFVSSSRHGTSYFFGPIRLKTSSSRPSSRTSVAVRPSRRRAWIWAVTRKTGAGSRWTSS